MAGSRCSKRASPNTPINKAFVENDAPRASWRRTWICGDQLTVADFALASALTLEQMAQLPVDGYAEIQRWSAQLNALPAWSTTLALQTAPAAAA
ncbi:MAG: glutathione binding-like protein [Alphaproteobacteria bacterium]